MITTDTHVFFYRSKEVYSNFHIMNGIQYQFVDPNTGLKFSCSEQHFMWSKANFFGDTNSAAAIASEYNPAEAKLLGRRVNNFNEKAWNCVKLGVMTYSCYLKFSQNPSWGKMLLSTNKRTLVEASPMDCVWGIGLDITDPLILDEKNWKGQNLLGVALGNVRSLL